MVRRGLIRSLQGPFLTGRLAFLCAIVALTIPTLIRIALDGFVTGCEFTAYLPFVLGSAILLRWWQAGLIALGAVAVVGGLFMGSPAELLQSTCFSASALIFLGASAAMIGTVILVRRLFLAMHRRGVDESAGGIVFSLHEGQVWASWYGQGPPMLIGSQAKVSAMMEDFLAQIEVGKRLAGRR